MDGGNGDDGDDEKWEDVGYMSGVFEVVGRRWGSSSSMSKHDVFTK